MHAFKNDTQVYYYVCSLKETSTTGTQAYSNLFESMVQARKGFK